MFAVQVLGARLQMGAILDSKKFKISRSWQFDLEGIENLQGEDVMPLGAQLRKFIDQCVLFIEEIGDEDDKAALPAEVARICHHGGEIAPSGRRGGGEGGTNSRRVPAAVASGQDGIQPVLKKPNRRCVALGGCEMRKSGGHPRRIVIF